MEEVIGYIKLGNKVRISDPCYDLDTWCAGTVKDVQPGEYKCSIFHKEGRVSHLMVVNKESAQATIIDFTEDSGIDVGVDAGVCGIFDQAYWEQINKTKDSHEIWYEEKVVAQDSDAVITDGVGVFSNSGWGDGSYTCSLRRNSDGLVNGFLIDYLMDAEDNEDDEYWDEDEQPSDVFWDEEDDE